MKVYVTSIMCLVSLTLAEPPVGDGYPDARSSHDHHHQDHSSDNQRSLSQEYGLPSDTITSARNAPSTGYEYNAPNARSSKNSRKFPPATVRVSFNQRFSSSAARNSAQDHNAPVAKSLSQEHAGLSARNGISQQYGPPAARSLSQEYGTPSVMSARTLSTEYGMPDARSSPSQEYGVPIVAARSNQKPQSSSNFRSAQPAKGSQDYSAPAARSQFQTDSSSRGYTAPSARSNNGAQSFAKSAFTPKNSPSSTYGAPSSRSLDASSARSLDSQNYDSVAQTYGAPSQMDLSETYDAPNARGLSQEYGVPSSRSNHQMTSTIPSSYSSDNSRSSPSSTYLPAARNAMPSEQYGVPEQGYENSRASEEKRARALEELQNQEPANYDFGYQIEDQESGSDFGHTETREEDHAQGSYFVVLPDGTKQTVDYSADEDGYKPRISVEPAAGGYDENAADVTGRATGGPY